jgi:hypothetical protein
MKMWPILLVMALPAVLSDKRDITVLRRSPQAPNEYALMPHLSPAIYVKQVSGHPMAEKTDIQCHWSQQVSAQTGLPSVTGDCDNGVKLVITGIDLNY